MADGTVRIEAVVAGGAGLAREASGRVVFVEGALPGEDVDISVDDEHRDYARAGVAAILTASRDRVAPRCPFVAAGCGGCGWQHVAPAAQLWLKEQIVADALRRSAGLDELPPITTTHAGVGGRRTTVRMGVLDGRAAFRRRGSTSLVAVDACMVSHPLVSDVLAASRFDGADEVLVRVSEATGRAVVIVDPPSAVVAARVPGGVTVGTTRDGTCIEEVVAGHRFRVTGDAFFQASAGVAEALVEAVARAAGPVAGHRVVDAYGGVGLFARAVAVAGGARSTVVIESDPVAAADARHNLGRDAKVIRCEVGRWRPSGADVVIADPARPGLGKPGVRALTAAQPSVLVLVSCDPASLARDTALLSAAGYLAEAVALVDAFPETPHVEAVTRFVSERM